MEKFLVKGTNQACLEDRIENAKTWSHTDLRSVEAKIFRISEMRLHDYFMDEIKLIEFIRMSKKYGFNITTEMSYKEVATIIYNYNKEYPNDRHMMQLITMFMYPIESFAKHFEWNNFSESLEKIDNNKSKRNCSINKILKKNNAREFYIWMDEYVNVLEQIFPNAKFEKCFNDEIYLKPPFSKQVPMLMEFVYGVVNDIDLLYDKRNLLLKYMIEPFYRICEIQNEVQSD